MATKRGRSNVRKINDQIRSASGGTTKKKSPASATATPSTTGSASRSANINARNRDEVSRNPARGGGKFKGNKEGTVGRVNPISPTDSYAQTSLREREAYAATQEATRSKSGRKSPFAKIMKDGVAKSRKKKRKAPTYRG